MKDEKRDSAGELISFKTRKTGSTVYRSFYLGPDGEKKYGATWYFSKMLNGVLRRFPCGQIAKDAETHADQIAGFLMLPNASVDEAWKRFNSNAAKRGSLFSTFGELFEFHSKSWGVLDISAKSGMGYQQAMLVVLRYGVAVRSGKEFEDWSGQRHLDEKRRPWLEKSLAILTGSFALDYKRGAIDATLEDEEDIVTAKISCDSNLRSARALFSNDAMRLYRASSNLELPDLKGFMDVPLYNAKKYFELPRPEVVRRIFTGAPELKASDPNAYRAFLACVQFGLRKSEAAAFRMEWLVEGESPEIRIREDGKFKPKHGHGRHIFLEPWTVAELRELAGDRTYFLDGADTERTDQVFERLNKWLRKQGVDATKPTHELRKLWFSQKVKREGISNAARQGGHKDVKITQSFYADASIPDNVLPFWTEPTLAALAKVRSA